MTDALPELCSAKMLETKKIQSDLKKKLIDKKRKAFLNKKEQIIKS